MSRHKAKLAEENGKRRAFSYDRVSRWRKGGHSIERQDDFAHALSTEHGWILDDTLVFIDKNRSGYHGHNLRLGAALTRCLACIESGRIKPGDVLIVEALDRLSREEVDVAYDLIRRILQAGVWIATEIPPRI